MLPVKAAVFMKLNIPPSKRCVPIGPSAAQSTNWTERVPEHGRLNGAGRVKDPFTKICTCWFSVRSALNMLSTEVTISMGEIAESEMLVNLQTT
jgi:hypothetical protein